MSDRFQVVQSSPVGRKLSDADFANGCPAAMLPPLPTGRTWTLARFKVAANGAFVWLEFESETPA